MLTVQMVEKALPANLRSAATQAFVDQINTIVADPLVAEQVRDNFVSYSGVLRDGKFKTEDYLHAVTYVSFKLMGMSNKDAYLRAFPNRYQALLAKGTTDKDISSYVAAYSKGKLVNLIMEQTLVPSWVLNQDLYQKALNVQADLMVTAQSEMVRTTAANSLLTHLTKPKEVGPLISLDLKEASGLKDLKDMMVQLARVQQQTIGVGGMTTKDIASQKLVPMIEGDVVDVTPGSPAKATSP